MKLDLGLALLGLLLLAEAAAAERWDVSIGGLPPTRVGDSRAYLHGHAPDARPASPAVALAEDAADAKAEAAAPALTYTRRAQRGAHVPAATPHLLPATRPEQLMRGGPPAPAMPADHAALLAREYRIADLEDARRIWRLQVLEPGALSDQDKRANAVVRYILSRGRAPAGSSATPPSALKPDATSAVVKVPGLATRASPWGPSVGTPLAEGSVVELQPLAHGAWYRRAGNTAGWIPGVWLDLK